MSDPQKSLYNLTCAGCSLTARCFVARGSWLFRKTLAMRDTSFCFSHSSRFRCRWASPLLSPGLNPGFCFTAKRSHQTNYRRSEPRSRCFIDSNTSAWGRRHWASGSICQSLDKRDSCVPVEARQRSFVIALPKINNM